MKNNKYPTEGDRKCYTEDNINHPFYKRTNTSYDNQRLL